VKKDEVSVVQSSSVGTVKIVRTKETRVNCFIPGKRSFKSC